VRWRLISAAVQALAARPDGATTVDIASAAGISRGVAGEVLAELETSRTAERQPVGLDYWIWPGRPGRYWDHPCVIFSAVYLLVRCLLSCLMVLAQGRGIQECRTPGTAT
jgi:hypothetical protein